MRIGVNTLFLIPDEVGGSEIYLCETLKALLATEAGHEFVLFTGREERGHGVLQMVGGGPAMGVDQRVGISGHLPETFPLHTVGAALPWTLFTDSQVPSRRGPGRGPWRET